MNKCIYTHCQRRIYKHQVFKLHSTSYNKRKSSYIGIAIVSGLLVGNRHAFTVLSPILLSQSPTTAVLSVTCIVLVHAVTVVMEEGLGDHSHRLHIVCWSRVDFLHTEWPRY